MTAFALGLLTATIVNAGMGLLGWKLYPLYLAARMVRQHAEHNRNLEQWLEQVPVQRVVWEGQAETGTSGVKRGDLN